MIVSRDRIREHLARALRLTVENSLMSLNQIHEADEVAIPLPSSYPVKATGYSTDLHSCGQQLTPVLEGCPRRGLGWQMTHRLLNQFDRRSDHHEFIASRVVAQLEAHESTPRSIDSPAQYPPLADIRELGLSGASVCISHDESGHFSERCLHKEHWSAASLNGGPRCFALLVLRPALRSTSNDGSRCDSHDRKDSLDPSRPVLRTQRVAASGQGDAARDKDDKSSHRERPHSQLAPCWYA